VKSELEATLANSSTSRDRNLNVELRIREQDMLNSGGVRKSEPEPTPACATHGTVIRWFVLTAILAIAGVYVAFHIGKGWVPADDGTLSQSALRVMRGQLPHRDFGEIYTGGLSFIHALAFRAFGVNLMSLRICVFLFFLAWVPAVYYIALRFIPPIPAGLITLLAVVWSYPNYPAAMPSWYNLFFATFGAAALLRYLDVRTRRWLFVAGLCGGVSLLVKVIGAYYIAGVFLFLAFLEQSESVEEEQSKNSWLYRAFSVAALLAFLGIVVEVLRARLGMAELYHFVLPSAVVVGLIVLGERNVRATSGQRFRALFRTVVPFSCGLIVPIAVFLIPYAKSGTVSQFFYGVTSSAISRAAGLGVVRPLGVAEAIWVLPLVGVIAAAMYWDKFQGQLVGTALGFAALVIAIKAAYSFEIVTRIWHSVALLTPIAVLLGAVLVYAQKNSGARTKLQHQQIVLLISLAATCSLVQFPFAAAIYLSYMVPLTLLAIVAIVSTGRTQRGTYALAAVAGLYLMFGVVSLVPLYIYEITSMIGPMYTMHGARTGGLKIEEAVFFDDLARFLREHSPNGLMYAGNDCPELYFLSGLKNVTKDDGGSATIEEVLKAVQSNDLKLVVINEAPFFPLGRMNEQVRAEVMQRFPHSSQIGIFHVFWRE